MRKRGRVWTSESGRKAALARWAKKPDQEDVDEEMRRAKRERMGEIFREIEVRNPRGNSVVFVLRWSTKRADRIDVTANGEPIGEMSFSRFFGRLRKAACQFR